MTLDFSARGREILERHKRERFAEQFKKNLQDLRGRMHVFALPQPHEVPLYLPKELLEINKDAIYSEMDSVLQLYFKLGWPFSVSDFIAAIYKYSQLGSYLTKDSLRSRVRWYLNDYTSRKILTSKYIQGKDGRYRDIFYRNK